MIRLESSNTFPAGSASFDIFASPTRSNAKWVQSASINRVQAWSRGPQLPTADPAVDDLDQLVRVPPFGVGFRRRIRQHVERVSLSCNESLTRERKSAASLVVFPPGISAPERRWVRLARGWPMWGALVWVVREIWLSQVTGPWTASADADERLGRGQMSAADHELTWWRVYNEMGSKQAAWPSLIDGHGGAAPARRRRSGCAMPIPRRRTRSDRSPRTFREPRRSSLRRRRPRRDGRARCVR